MTLAELLREVVLTLETGRLRARTPNNNMPPPKPTIEDIKEEIKLTKIIIDIVKVAQA